MCKFDLADKQTCKQTEMIDLDRAVASRKAQPFLKKVKNATISHKKNAAIDAPDGSGAHLSKLGSEPEAQSILKVSGTLGPRPRP